MPRVMKDAGGSSTKSTHCWSPAHCGAKVACPRPHQLNALDPKALHHKVTRTQQRMTASYRPHKDRQSEGLLVTGELNFRASGNASDYPEAPTHPSELRPIGWRTSCARCPHSYPNSRQKRLAFRSPAVNGKKRCRMHGGAEGSGAPKGNQNALKHGTCTKEAFERRARLREYIREAEKLPKDLARG